MKVEKKKRNVGLRCKHFRFFAHSKRSGRNYIIKKEIAFFFFFTEYDILKINIFVTIF